MLTKSVSARSTLDAACSRLRALAFSVREGELVGAETDLIEALGVSRATLRQAARLIEAEGLMVVRRGPSGGYFSARPNTQTLESVFGAYLKALNLDIEEAFMVGFALWTEVVRQVALIRAPEVVDMTASFRERLAHVPATGRLVDVYAFEDDYRRSMFKLVKRPYVELIFTLNRAVTWRQFTVPALGREGGKSHPAFIKAWRARKHAELDAIEAGDEAQALLAATRDRELWYDRLVVYGAWGQTGDARESANRVSAPTPEAPSRPARARAAKSPPRPRSPRR